MKITIDSVVFESKTQESVLEVLLEKEFDINHSCGGMGSCGTCRIIVSHPLEDLPERNEIEKEMAEDRGFSHRERLACQLEPIDGLIANTPKRMLDEQ